MLLNTTNDSQPGVLGKTDYTHSASVTGDLNLYLSQPDLDIPIGELNSNAKLGDEWLSLASIIMNNRNTPL